MKKRPKRWLLSLVKSPILSFRIRFSRDWKMVREALETSQRFGEYGSGVSTIYADGRGVDKIVSVETDPRWANTMRAMLSDRVQVIHADVGPVGRWGRPIDYTYAGQFDLYFELLFGDGCSPDTILIDGRFRVACFLTCYLRAKPGTTVIWDDYVKRGQYHVVEALLAPNRLNARQAQFVIPQERDLVRAKKLLTHFRFVMD